MLLVGMLASRMRIADFEEASHASYSTGAFTVISIASWKAGTPAGKHTHTVSPALRALHRRGLVTARAIPHRSQYQRSYEVTRRRPAQGVASRYQLVGTG